MIREGDTISINIPEASVNVLVREEELQQRRSAYVKPEPSIKTGWLARYARMVTGADQGAVLK